MDEAICKSKEWKERNWELNVQFQHEGKRRGFFCTQWPEFRRASCISVKDRLVFEFRNSKDFVVLAIFRHQTNYVAEEEENAVKEERIVGNDPHIPNEVKEEMEI